MPRGEEVSDGLEPGVVDLDESAGPIPDHEAEVLLDLEHDVAGGEARPELREVRGGETSRGIVRWIRQTGDLVWEGHQFDW